MVAAAETQTAEDESARLERRQRNRRRLVAIVSHLAALIFWEVAVRAFEVPRFILPAPSEILATLPSPRYDWIGNSWVTALEIGGGYLLATVLGVLSALAFSWSRGLTMALFPLLVTLNMIPKVALGPLVIVWFSYGISTNILITFSLCYFPILLTTVRGLREVEPDLLDLVKSLRGSRLQMFIYIQLPGALPYIFSGMKVAAILAVAGAVVGEFIASDRGLGYLMIQVQAALDTPAMFMAVTLITLIGIALYMAVMAVEHMVLPKDARMS
ncbi:ABC transporter permease [Martelella mediterranea]|uniref:ABC transporter permease n=1 Tax=Martelella mediterranea TaxID=293089 RepID=UPI000C8EA5E0|nr:ABC transporter permease [Martelella mediterranea]MAM12452.1 nitrate ABC transporter permease [Rhizobiaceae bacterium]MCD1634793.1 ABC transporter permease [Martelella mediterranea]